MGINRMIPKTSESIILFIFVLIIIVSSVNDRPSSSESNFGKVIIFDIKNNILLKEKKELQSMLSEIKNVDNYENNDSELLRKSTNNHYFGQFLSGVVKNGPYLTLEDGFINVDFRLSSPITNRKIFSYPLEKPMHFPEKETIFHTSIDSEEAILKRAVSLPLEEKEIDLEKKSAKDRSKRYSMYDNIREFLKTFEVIEDDEIFRVVIPGVNLFVQNSLEISQYAKEILEPVARAVKLDDEIDLLIIGHTDSTKNRDDSNKISLIRADLVKRLLHESFGIYIDRMKTYGKGKSVPIASNSTFDGRRENRRIEILFRKIK